MPENRPTESTQFSALKDVNRVRFVVSDTLLSDSDDLFELLKSCHTHHIRAGCGSIRQRQQKAHPLVFGPGECFRRVICHVSETSLVIVRDAAFCS
jgi:hypothetical protein